jgi:hypothetical protein
MKPMTAGVAAALVSGVVMFTVGAKADSLNAFNQSPALVQTADGQFVPANYSTALRPAAAPTVATVTPMRTTRTAPAPRRTVSRAPQSTREIIREEDRREIAREDDHSWGKTAMIVGGSAAGGAGVGGIVGGKKGALIGAAIGGGAASIYEATQRR